MVAYSFQKRFAPRIEDGTKCHTIRADRRRHARPGEALQLYVGMRTTSCRKVIADPLCTSVEQIRIGFAAAGQIAEALIDDQPVSDLDEFAIADGFESLSDMEGFWTMRHGLLREFRGVLIAWVPVAKAQP